MTLADPAQSKIAILGAPTSGKTTFLAALRIALDRQQKEDQSLAWTLIGDDEASVRQLEELTSKLDTDRAFPVATPVGSIEQYRWRLIGPAWHTVKRRWLGTKRVLQTVQIAIDLADASGEMANPKRYDARKTLVANLTQCQGIVFLFDPVVEAQKPQAFYYTRALLDQLAASMKDELIDGRLPQYVAVCVSKFDDTRVLETAEKLDILMRDPADPYEFPRVPGEDARDFFIRLCGILNAGDADMLLNTIERRFRHVNVRYFISSAIGFNVDRQSNVYDPDDPQNLLPAAIQQDARIRGAIHPINVVEPLMWLTGQLTGAEPA